MPGPSPTSAPSTVAHSYRLGVASRAVAAIVGGYALAYAFAACAGRWLPLARSEAVLTATLLSFLVYGGAALWVFCVRRAWHAWVGLVLGTALLGGLAALGAVR
ncbi:DUF3649 domain-containing protein [Chitiniphilus shinanonensis]|uniref:DUF3649 domain-containing protein n=1 Tax=Chitiniphilus shinanonensis TaxID=553088 RepID=UPI00036C0227|nr:DUF3649 domain-containing protein [Chitiniphilus shinanonensis]